MHSLIFVTGASGAGKTTVVKMLEKHATFDLQFCYFDSIGVPSNEEMIKLYGSGENWQKATTKLWVKKIVNQYLAKKETILDGQMRLSFINDACSTNEIVDYRIFLFDCNDEVRKMRLIGRGQPELANKDMMNWSKFLRVEAAADERATIFDTSRLSLQETVDRFAKLI